jgi:hypothetical protein
MTAEQLSDKWDEILENQGEDKAEAWFENLTLDEQLRLLAYWKKLGG